MSAPHEAAAHVAYWLSDGAGSDGGDWPPLARGVRTRIEAGAELADAWGDEFPEAYRYAGDDPAAVIALASAARELIEGEQRLRNTAVFALVSAGLPALMVAVALPVLVFQVTAWLASHACAVPTWAATPALFLGVSAAAVLGCVVAAVAARSPRAFASRLTAGRTSAYERLFVSRWVCTLLDRNVPLHEAFASAGAALGVSRVGIEAADLATRIRNGNSLRDAPHPWRMVADLGDRTGEMLDALMETLTIESELAEELWRERAQAVSVAFASIFVLFFGLVCIFTYASTITCLQQL